jgi:hypothetical protein
MKESIKLLEAGFESSSGKTPEFKHFARVFKKEFTQELKSIDATDIVFNVGHFYISGFFTINGQVYYFSIPDVRGMNYCLANNPDSCMCQLMYRTAKHYKDFTGGQNRYVKIRFDMAQDMCWSFKVV